jgi:hypothetical protein
MVMNWCAESGAAECKVRHVDCMDYVQMGNWARGAGSVILAES